MNYNSAQKRFENQIDWLWLSSSATYPGTEHVTDDFGASFSLSSKTRVKIPHFMELLRVKETEKRHLDRASIGASAW